MRDDAIPKRWRLAGIVAALTALLLSATAIHVSTRDVQYGTRLWAAPVMEPGGAAAVRLAARFRAGGELDTGASARVSLVPSNESDKFRRGPPPSASTSRKAVHLGEIEANHTGLIEGVFDLPPDMPFGPYIVLVGLSAGDGTSEVAAFPVTVGEAESGMVSIRPACEESSIRRSDGGWHPSRRCERPGRFHLYPEAGHLVAQTTAPLHFWLEPGEETSLPRFVELREKEPASHSSPNVASREATALLPLDSLGLGSHDYTPGFPRGAIELAAADIEERIWLRDLPGPVTLVTEKQLLEPGEILQLEVRLTRPNRPVYIDIWVDGRWVGAHSGHVRGKRERLGAPMPEGTRGLVMARASMHPEGGASSVVGAWIDEEIDGPAVARLARALGDLPLAQPLADYGSSPPSDEPLLSFIATLEEERLRELRPDESRRASAALLSRLEPTEAAPPLLGDTTGAKLLALDEWKKRIRRPLLLALMLVATGTLGTGAWIAISYHRGVRRRLAQLACEDEGEACEADLTGGGWLGPGLLLCIVVIGAIATLLVFLETLQWDRGDVFAARQREAAAETRKEGSHSQE